MEFWHQRYQQQASWTQALRLRVYSLVGLARAERVLEVGCGTGVITHDLHQQTGARVYGLDLSYPAVAFAARHDPQTCFVQGDGFSLPFSDHAFDTAITHYLLLWIGHPERLLRETMRVVRPGGSLLCLAEPDYEGRIDHPDRFKSRGQRQARGLQQRGADPAIGRKLPGLLTRLGLVEVQAGILGAEWSAGRPPADIRLECQMLALDCGLPTTGRSLEDLVEQEAAAWESGERVLYVPTFYAFGRKAEKL
ncbi:MAG: methyltransferase domain-containing protein [Chloroflexota bacterium]